VVNTRGSIAYSPAVTTLAIVQARMGSTRLPGKVLREFAGRSALAHCVARTRASAAIDDVVVATTERADDDAIVDACRAHDWRWFRGAEHDVLDRYYRAAVDAGAPDDAAVVRITADCPLTDPAVITALCERFRAARADYASTSYPAPTFPLGISVEVMTFAALATAWREDGDPTWREHVTPFLYRNPDRFAVVGLASGGAYAHHRWTLDTPDDAIVIGKLLDAVPAGALGWRDTLAIAEAHPDWQAINAGVEQRRVR
jgi:spore coat polysaccharide biosynthesis protein SpsF